jgi:hypothetical protein
MAISQADFEQELRTKPTETSADQNLYFTLDAQQFLRVGPRLEEQVRLLAHDPDDDLDDNELKNASHPPFWMNGRPDFGTFANAPTSFDSRDWQTPSKDQLDRGTCVAFAAVACLEALYKRAGKDLNLSEQYAYWLFMHNIGQGKTQCDDFVRTTLAARFLSLAGVCPTSPATTYKSVSEMIGRCGDEPEQTVKDSAAYGFGNYSILNRTAPAPAGLTGPSVANTDYLECILSQGHDIVLQLDVAWGRAIGKIHDVINDTTGQPSKPRGSHAMLLIGYVRNSHFVFKNSWFDAANGSQVSPGELLLSYTYVRQYARFGFVAFKTADFLTNFALALHRLKKKFWFF